MARSLKHALAAACGLGALMAGQAAQAQTPTAAPGFTLSVFAHPPAGVAKPDSIAIAGGHVWVGYGDKAPPDGSSGTSSVVEYTMAGVPVRTLTVAGHNDGLRVDPTTGYLWALQNEDAVPTRILINPQTGAMSTTAALTTVNGGGYDDVAYLGGGAFISASNPTLTAANLDLYPALVRYPEGNVTGTPATVLMGNASAVSVLTGKTVTLNLTDPDSTITTPSGDILLDSQGDGILVLVRLGERAKQGTAGYPKNLAPLPDGVADLLDNMAGSGPYDVRAVAIPLQGGNQVDDTVFTSSSNGTMFISDTPNNIVYQLSSQQFLAGHPYSAAGPNGTAAGFVGRLNMETGALYPVVTGLGSPHGLAFLPAAVK